MTKHKSKKSKLDKTRSWDEQEDKKMNITATIASTETSGSVTGSDRNRFSFVSEVSSMLYAYGDVRHPLNETASLVEEIVHQQMCSLIQLASEIASTRSSSSLGLEEFLFLLRKSMIRLSRFGKRMYFFDSHAKLLGRTSQEGSSIPYEQVKEEHADDDDSSVPSRKTDSEPKMKRWNICLDFLLHIDDSGELARMLTEPIEDVAKMKRLERAEIQTRNMNETEYMEYVKCRRVSFGNIKGSRNKKSFRDWFDFDLLQVNLRPTNYGWEALEYLAQETISELVDYALIVRSENIPPLLPCESEPNARHMPLYASTSLPDRAEVLNSSLVKTDSDLGSCSTDGGSSTIARKRKSSESTAANSSSVLNRKLALKPTHIHEAMRRFYGGNHVETFLSKSITVANRCPRNRLLCLI